MVRELKGVGSVIWWRCCRFKVDRKAPREEEIETNNIKTLLVVVWVIEHYMEEDDFAEMEATQQEEVLIY